MTNFIQKRKRDSSKQGFRSRFTFKQAAFVVITVTLSACIVIGLYGLALSNRVLEIDDQWAEYEQDASGAAYSLALIKSHFGYGGFIHNFKSYLLLKESALVVQIEHDLRETYRSINNYPVDNDHESIHHSIEAIRDVVDQYTEKFKLAQRLIAEKKSSYFISQRVQVDDKPAIEAIQLLNQHILQHSREQVSRTNLAVENVLWLLSWGVLLVLGVIVVGGLVVAFIHYNLRLNEQLEDSHQYLSHLFESAPDAMLVVDKSGLIASVNPKATEVLGYSRDELCQMKVEELIPVQLQELHVVLRENAFTNSAQRYLSEQIDINAINKEGKEIPLEISLSYTKNDESMQAIVTLRDITERKQMEKELRHKENILSKAQKIAHVGSWEWNIITNTLYWSDEVYAIYGLNTDEFKASFDGFVKGVHSDDRIEVIKAVNDSVVFDEPYKISHRITRPNGEDRHVQERGDVFRDENGEAQYMIGTVLDVTEQKHAEQEFRLADNVFSHTTEAIVVTDLDNKILRVNQAFEFVTGFTANEVVGKRPQDVISSGKHDKKFYEQMWGALNNNGFWEGELWDKRKDGTIFPALHNISAIKDDYGKVFQYTSVFSDITEKKIAEEKIQQLAQFDHLTQLPNRALFIDRLTHALSSAKRQKKNIGLMFIDLDHFKKVNDTFGHQAGDLLLQEVARRLTACVREQDTVSRLGGDEFTVILEELTQPEDVAIVAEKILKALSQKVKLDEEEIQIGGSIGISIYPDDGSVVNELIKKADMAMYVSKKQGKNQYQFYKK